MKGRERHSSSVGGCMDGWTDEALILNRAIRRMLVEKVMMRPKLEGSLA